MNSSELPPVRVVVQGKSLHEILMAIDTHLRDYKKKGWNISKGSVGQDNKCRYNIYKDGETTVVEFDPTSSLHFIGDDMIGLTIGALVMGMPQAQVYLNDLADQEQQRKSKEWHDKYDIIIYTAVLVVLFILGMIYYPHGIK